MPVSMSRALGVRSWSAHKWDSAVAERNSHPKADSFRAQSSDAMSDVKVGAAFGLRFNLPAYLVELYKQLKNDLPTFNDDPSWTLPMPAPPTRA